METLSPRSACEQEPLPSHIAHQIIAYPPAKPRGLILDMDGTLYRNDGYLAHTRAVDLHIIADHLRLPPERAHVVIEKARRALGATLGTPRARLTQTLIECFHMNMDEWNTRRAHSYEPENYLQPDPNLPPMLSRLLERFDTVCIASNSPRASLQKILHTLHVPDVILSRLRLFTPDTLAFHKPDPSFFRTIAESIDLPPEQCMSVGNEADNDAYPAILCGMGAAIVQGPSHISPALQSLTDGTFLTPLSFEDIRERFQRHDGPYILGIVGRAGAGKSTFARTLLHEHIDHSPNVHPHIIPLDAFFRLSSSERSTWLSAPDICDAERRLREDMSQWWDFERASYTLQRLRSGQPVHLDSVYNQEDGGRKTGTLHIEPTPNRGNLYIVDGVGTPLLSPLLDGIIFVHAHEVTRRLRVYERDKIKRGLAAAEQRWNITQRFENTLYHDGGNALLDEQPLSVIDNSLHTSDSPHWRSLPAKIPAR